MWGMQKNERGGFNEEARREGALGRGADVGDRGTVVQVF